MGRRDRNNGRTNSKSAARYRRCGNTGWSVLTEAVKTFGPAAIIEELSKNYSNDRQVLGGSQESAAHFKYKQRK